MCSITKGKYTFVFIFNHIIDFFFTLNGNTRPISKMKKIV